MFLKTIYGGIVIRRGRSIGLGKSAAWRLTVNFLQPNDLLPAKLLFEVVQSFFLIVKSRHSEEVFRRRISLLTRFKKDSTSPLRQAQNPPLNDNPMHFLKV